MRPKIHELFDRQAADIINSKGKLCFPNVKEVTDPQEGLNLINRSNMSSWKPYELRIQNFDPPKNGTQTHEVAWYPKIFLNTKGMAGKFDGSGVILASPRHDGVARVFTFAICEHEWDQSGANHQRGWHPAYCTKCGFDASIDSGD